jgi:hypothetical protein
MLDAYREIYIGYYTIREHRCQSRFAWPARYRRYEKTAASPKYRIAMAQTASFLAFYRFDSLMGICYFLIIKPNK